MTGTGVGFSVHEKVLQWQLEADLSTATIQQPRRTSKGTLTVLVDARAADARATALTIASIFSGSVQRSFLQVLMPNSADSVLLEQWLASESDVHFVRSVKDVVAGDQYLLVCPAGVVLGTYSIEAAVEAANETGASLLRALVDGASGTLELWKSAALGSPVSLTGAEQAIRNQGGERWISGASLGAHACYRPAPKQFLRKGRAGTFDVHVVVKDLKDPATRLDYEHQVRRLEAELARVKRHQWQAATRDASPGTARTPLHALRKGPRYLASRAAARLRYLNAGMK
ncbi:MAG: hypothetical protein ACQEXN_05665 [Actinomycetota bacterium]